jgi:hypothetical protein
MVHGMVGFHLIHQPNLHPVTDREAPVDRGAVGAGSPVDEPPVVVADVVRRLISTMSSSHSIPSAVS